MVILPLYFEQYFSYTWNWKYSISPTSAFPDPCGCLKLWIASNPGYTGLFFLNHTYIHTYDKFNFKTRHSERSATTIIK
jgi:hypothetical protein